VHTSRDRVTGLALVLGSAAAFGTMPVFGKVAYRSGAEPVALLAVRFALAATVLVAVRAVLARRGAATPWPRGRALATLLALGAVVYLVQSLSFFRALELAPAALVTILLYLYPGVVVLLAAVFLGERPPRAVVGCLLLSVLGVGLTVGPVRGDVDPLGPALGVASAACYSVYIVLSSRVVPRVGPLTAICVVLTGAAAGYAALATAVRPEWPGDLGGWLACVAVGLVGTVFAMLAFFAGLARLGPTDTSVASTLEPVVAALLGLVVLGETLTGLQAAGAALVLAAVVVLARVRARTPRPGLVGVAGFAGP
jgi:drug/metabolite transporter (DMT)-like permease